MQKIPETSLVSGTMLHRGTTLVAAKLRPLSGDKHPLPPNAGLTAFFTAPKAVRKRSSGMTEPSVPLPVYTKHRVSVNGCLRLFSFMAFAAVFN